MNGTIDWADRECVNYILHLHLIPSKFSSARCVMKILISVNLGNGVVAQIRPVNDTTSTDDSLWAIFYKVPLRLMTFRFLSSRLYFQFIGCVFLTVFLWIVHLDFNNCNIRLAVWFEDLYNQANVWMIIDFSRINENRNNLNF